MELEDAQRTIRYLAKHELHASLITSALAGAEADCPLSANAFFSPAAVCKPFLIWKGIL